MNRVLASVAGCCWETGGEPAAAFDLALFLGRDEITDYQIEELQLPILLPDGIEKVLARFNKVKGRLKRLKKVEDMAGEPAARAVRVCWRIPWPCMPDRASRSCLPYDQPSPAPTLNPKNAPPSPAGTPAGFR